LPFRKVGDTKPAATRRLKNMRILVGCLWAMASAATLLADVAPSALFTDHAVLQSGMPVPIWGTSAAGERVTVTLNGQTQSTTASTDGKWMVRLKSLEPGGPYVLTIAGTNTITVHDVLVGEVWLGSGQSNMAFTVSKKNARYAGVIHEEEEIAAANYPKVRMFTAKTAKTYEPQSEIQGEWKICNPENAGDFSAVGYYFSRDLHQELKVPVGFLTVAFGASTAEAWISRETIAADPLLKAKLEHFDAAVKFFREHPDAPPEQAPAAPATINARPGPAPKKQRDPVQDQHNPTVLFNGMLHPVIGYAIRGAIWYQGESIVGGPDGVALYPHVQNTLVTEWRKLWGQGEFPFYVVQLPALQNTSNNPLVREGQAAVLTLPHTAMAVTIDIGDPTDVHPHNKAPLGERLTRIALANVYERKIEYSGPVFDSMKVADHTIRVKFSHIGGGLVAKDGPLKWFAVAGDDRQFHAAQATIEGDTVIVSTADVSQPVAVRYAWDNYPDGCNLFNAAGLPAAPFRSDRWPYKY
jgi:sialate O-acetylesterase